VHKMHDCACVLLRGLASLLDALHHKIVCIVACSRTLCGSVHSPRHEGGISPSKVCVPTPDALRARHVAVVMFNRSEHEDPGLMSARSMRLYIVKAPTRPAHQRRHLWP
jgi:hypothetical protein